MNNLVVEQCLVPRKVYDCLFVAVGHEERCLNVAEKICGATQSRHAWVYSSDLHERASHHRERIAGLGFKSHESRDCDPRATIRQLIQHVGSPERPGAVCVDISCLTRELMAVWVYEAMMAQFSAPSLQIDFLYSHAHFTEPPTSMGLALTPSAIIPEFAGCFSQPTSPMLLVLGIGYEPHLALGFLEYLDPARVVVFEPAHHDRRYTRAILDENETFLRLVKHSPRVKYNVYRPFALFQDLEAVIHGGVRANRVNVAPYGLKLFVMCSLLAAAINYPDVFVWHLNPERLSEELPGDRVATGRISAIRVKCMPSASVGDPWRNASAVLPDLW